MQGVYNASYKASSVNSARTLMYLTAPSNAVVEILSITVSQNNVVAAEQLEIGVAAITTVGSPTATTITPKPSEEATGAFGGVVKANVTANDVVYEVDGSSIPLYYNDQGVSNAAGFFWSPAPEERSEISPGDSVGVALISTPANVYNFVINFSFRLIGG